ICFPHKTKDYKEQDENNFYLFLAFLPDKPTPLIQHVWDGITKQEVTEIISVKNFPSSKAHAFLASMGNKTDNRFIWRNGLLIQQENEAVLIEFIGKNEISLRIKAENHPGTLYQTLLKELEIFFNSFGLNPQTFIVRQGEKNLKTELREQPQQKIPELVVSYAQEEFWFLKELDKSLSSYKLDYGLNVSYDIKETTGVDEWTEEIEAAFKRADGYIILASNNYID